MTSPDRVMKAAGLLMGISVLSRLAGFVREQAIAAQFGTSMSTDAYVVSLTIINVVYLVLGGALATVFIPVFTSVLAGEKGRTGSDAAWRLASSVLNLTALALGAISLLGILLSPQLVGLIVPSFSAEAAALTSQLTRIMFPITLLAALSMLVGGILNSLQHFTLPALSSVVFSLTVTAAAFTLGGEWAWGIRGLAAGTVLATVLQVLVQTPALKAKGIQYFPRLDLRQEEVRQVGRLMGPVVLGNLVGQAYLVIERYLASGLATGSISALNFANKLMYLPFNLFAVAVNIAIFPTLSEHAARQDRLALGRTTAVGLKLVGLLTIPAAAGMLALAEPLVRLVYQHGEFNVESTARTTLALYFYLPGLFALGGFNVLYRAFYALQDTRTPVAINILAVLANLGLGLLLVNPLKHAGLALAVALSANLNLVLSYLFLLPRLPGLAPRELLPPLGKILLVSALMGVVVWFTQQALGLVLGMEAAAGRTMGVGFQLVQVLTSAAAGVAVYAAGIKWIRADEETVSLVEHFLKELAGRLAGQAKRK
ncbi:MAG: murein biosynthesis integral membrane protein MurJ [Syntrophomonadaceae bacterium]|nr:murein biosynthesis integral membrane protein MurJ [Syntrophomonadaceae bacterium]